MGRESLIEAAKEAEQIANSVSEPFRSVLFAVALEKITTEQASRADYEVFNKNLEVPKVADLNGKTHEEILAAFSTTHFVLDELQREAFENGKTLDRSLLVLEYVDKHFGVPELTAPEIAKILSDNLMKGTTQEAVGMALKSSSNRFVTRRRLAKGFAYSLTLAGREHLKKLMKSKPV